MNDEVITYRLDSIETTLKDMKDLLVQTKLQQEQIDNLEKRQDSMDEKLDRMTATLEEVRGRPDKESARKWNYIVNYIFEALIAVAVGVLFAKMGLK